MSYGTGYEQALFKCLNIVHFIFSAYGSQCSTNLNQLLKVEAAPPQAGRHLCLMPLSPRSMLRDQLNGLNGSLFPIADQQDQMIAGLEVTDASLQDAFDERVVVLNLGRCTSCCTSM